MCGEVPPEGGGKSLGAELAHVALAGGSAPGSDSYNLALLVAVVFAVLILC